MRFLYRGFLEDDEKIKKIFRRPVIFVIQPMIFWGTVWALVVGACWFFYPQYNLEQSFDLSLIWQIALVIGIIHTLIPAIAWYINAIVMTNESVIIIDWPKPFERRSTRIDLHNLDEITTERVGWKSFFLNYGNVIFNKVNGGEPIIVRQISRPTRVARVVETYREWSLDKKNFTEESALKGLLSHVVKRHVGEHGQPQREKRDDRYETRHDPLDDVPEATPARVSEPVRRKKSKPVTQSESGLEIEKQLDDTGGIDIDLD